MTPNHPHRTARSAARTAATLTTSVLACVMLFLAAGAQPARASRDCGTYTKRGGPYQVIVVDGPVPCEKARRILRRYATSHALCTGSGCYRTISGWTCGSGDAQAYPRLFSCARGKRTVAALSVAD